MIKIGNKSNIQDGCVVHARGVFGNTTSDRGMPTLIGENVSLGHQACVHGCTIGDNVLIGIRSVVLDGAVIKPFSLIAAGAVVTPGKVVDGGLWGGIPAKKLRDLTDEETQMLIDNAMNYVELKEVWKQSGEISPSRM
jgi:carbonic anhydrase/acetyltransferase-like protein (isoleucine patch superfamily)